MESPRTLVLCLSLLLLGAATATPILDTIRQVTDQVASSGAGHGGANDLAATLMGAEKRFEGFMHKFGKVYHTVEEFEHRFAVFKDNLVKAVKHQALDPSAMHGVTQFSDLTEEEFTSQYLGLKAPETLKNAAPAPSLPTGDLPANFDWRDHGAVTPVKNQVWGYHVMSCLSGMHVVMMMCLPSWLSS
jgi:cathepsin F